MRESSIDYVAGEDFATYYTNDHKYVERLRKRIEQNPGVVKVLMDDPEFGMGVQVPKSWFREPAPPRRTKELTAEERAAVAERLNSARTKKNGGVGD